jgi:prepilin-type N-terminal cleavage/methylation domain-containing protein
MGRPDGFTLTELAIVLVIMSLLIGGMLVPLSAQRDIQRSSETQKQLSEIKDALFGFAIINGRLPCPTTQTDPANAGYGIEDSTCANVEGYLPWKTLGVPETDAWGSIRSASSDPFAGYWRYRADNAFSTAFTLTTPTASSLSVQDAAGNDLTQVTSSPVAVIYSTGPDLVPNGQNATIDTTYQAGERSPAFDDVTLWIGRPILLNRLVTAGTLP